MKLDEPGRQELYLVQEGRKGESTLTGGQVAVLGLDGVRQDDDDDDDDDDDCPLLTRQKSSMHSMFVAQGRRDIQISQ